MDTSTAEKIIETNSDYANAEEFPKVLNDEKSNVDENFMDTNSAPDISSDNNSLSLIPSVTSKERQSYTESIHSWFLGKVTEVLWDKGYFVSELRDIDKGSVNVVEFDIDSAFDDKEDAELKLFSGAIFAFYVFTIHGMGSPQTSTGLEFSVPYIWQEGDNEKVKAICDKIFPEELTKIST